MNDIFWNRVYPLLIGLLPVIALIVASEGMNARLTAMEQGFRQEMGAMEQGLRQEISSVRHEISTLRTHIDALDLG